ncbi:peptidoglycan-binding domain-containing protein [Leifsonia xyli]|jgi:hypothetical protein|uniref:peptidoglycan-binding domain-containing protein n=1 Tax=Leifsonia xyli TaxID=1575 RepID=UPI001185C0D9|nr:peptidoglycan-binding domain-containing protein [Leifsonia xyli]
MTADGGETSPKSGSSLQRVRRRGTLFAVGFSVLALIGASFVAGRFTTPPDRVVIEQAQQKIDVYVRRAGVRVRADSRIVYVAEVQEPISVTMTPQAVNEKMVVRMAVSPGDALQPGALIGVIGGFPYFALPGSLAPYRDLAAGDKGDDVKMLQNALNMSGYQAGEDGVVGRMLFNAVAAMYKANGVEGHSWSLISTAQFVSVEAMPAAVLSVPKVGSLLGKDNPLLTVSSGAPFLALNANSTLIRELTVGTELRAQVNGELTAVAVTNVANTSSSDKKESGEEKSQASQFI